MPMYLSCPALPQCPCISAVLLCHSARVSHCPALPQCPCISLSCSATVPVYLSCPFATVPVYLSCLALPQCPSISVVVLCQSARVSQLSCSTTVPVYLSCLALPQCPSISAVLLCYSARRMWSRAVQVSWQLLRQ